MLVYTDVLGQPIGPIFRGQMQGVDFDIRQLIVAVNAVLQCADVRDVSGSMLRCVDCETECFGNFDGIAFEFIKERVFCVRGFCGQFI